MVLNALGLNLFTLFSRTEVQSVVANVNPDLSYQFAVPIENMVSKRYKIDEFSV